MSWLDDYTCVVVGGGSGIGRKTTEIFSDEGADVFVVDIDADRISELSRQDGIYGIRADATDVDEMKSAIKEIQQLREDIDCLVVTVGIWDFNETIVEIPSEDLTSAFSELFRTNVLSVLSSVKALLSSFPEWGGNVILTVSNAGFYPGGGGPLYTASKFAVRGLVIELAHELAPDIRVNGVAPGGTRTQLSGVKSLSQENRVQAEVFSPEESAKRKPLQIQNRLEDHAWAYVYLASNEKSRAVTGEFIHTDAGLNASKP